MSGVGTLYSDTDLQLFAEALARSETLPPAQLEAVGERLAQLLRLPVHDCVDECPVCGADLSGE